MYNKQALFPGGRPAQQTQAQLPSGQVPADSAAAVIFALAAMLSSSAAFTSVAGPVMLIPLVLSVPYRLHKDKQDGIINEQYELEKLILFFNV